MQIIMFSGKTCAPCKIAKPLVENYCRYNGIDFRYVERESSDMDLFRQYSVMSLPTFVFINGEKIHKESGWVNLDRTIDLVVKQLK